jgi:hypothetical protein
MLKSLVHVETFTPFNQMLIFEEQLSTVCPICIFIFDTDQDQINSAYSA